MGRPSALVMTMFIGCWVGSPVAVPAEAQTPGTGFELFGMLADVDGDGDMDLLLHVFTADLAAQILDSTVTLSAQTFDGAQIVGTDTVRLVGPTSAGNGVRRLTCPH